ncbi:ATP-binding protein [Caulobacter sp. ErkDOM-YI]|uniref:hybrid sensor histidine kinase/response regulator n=1 Tax=unclassified Caulobacter TaxID=2648921 RepID=UPI003AF44772
MRRFLASVVLFGSLAVCAGAWAADRAPSTMAVRLEQLNDSIGAHQVRRPPRDNEDIERAGQKALRQKGPERLYGLWRVLYAYKSSQIQGAFDGWIAKTRLVARRDNDASLLALADLMVLTYSNETGGFQAFSEADWKRLLDHPSQDIRMMTGIERVRHLSQTGSWSEAALLAANLTVEIERRGEIARPLLAEAHQVHSYTLADIGDKEGALERMTEAAALDERDAFYMRKIERVYDIAYTAIEVGEIDAAERLAKLHHQMTWASGDPGLRAWDRFLCALVAEARESPKGVLACLPEMTAALANPDSRLLVVMLKRRLMARAMLGDAAEARSDLALLRAVPTTISERDPQTEKLAEAYIDQAEGRSREAFLKLDSWQRRDRVESDKAHTHSVAEMSAALESELRAKRDESRRLAAEVQLNRQLAQASGVIALLLALLVAGGVTWTINLRRASRHLREAQEHAEAANQAKSAFLAVMSHELRTPLNGMLGVAQSLRSEDLPPHQREQVDMILDSGDTLLVLLNDILDLSKIEAGKLEIAPTAGDLAQVCARLIGGYQPTARDKGIELVFRIEGVAPGPLLFDAVRLRQCLTNLVSNALKFTNTGQVEVTLSCGPDLATGRQRVRLRVLDSGIGMSEATLAKLFGAFTQADASTTRTFGGTGLGLNITRRLVELMGGDIQVQSHEGHGSIFVVEMLADACAASDQAPDDVDGAEDEPSFAALHGRRVLVVDDHPVNRRVIRLFLTPFECELIEAENGQEALDALEAGPIDIVLMDVNMPVMDGLTATRLLRADPRFERLPVIALTADVMSAQIKTCLVAGVDAHVAKPIDLRDLLSAMDRALSARVPAGRTASPDAVPRTA